MLISDVRMPDLDGLGLLERLIELDADLPVIMVTGHVPMAVQALRQGAYDFIEALHPERLLDSVRRAMDKRRLVCENRQLREQFARRGVSNRSCWACPVPWITCDARCWSWPGPTSTC